MGFVLLIFVVFCGVRIAHLFSFRWGAYCSSLQFSVGFVLLISLVFGGVVLLIFLVFGGDGIAHLFSFLWGRIAHLFSFLWGRIAHLFSFLWGSYCSSF